MRERLTAMIESARYWGSGTSAEIADYLLANGVIVCDTLALEMENRPLITQCLGRPLDEIIELVQAKDDGRIIVPPCKVGDTVYIVDGSTDGIVMGKITHFEFNLYTTPKEWITVRGNYPFVGELEEKNRIDLLLGKTVFLTREEAEKALAERSEG